MQEKKMPDPMTLHPVPGYENEIYVKPSLTNGNIVVGDFTYIADKEFESHVTNFYPWSRDRLVIGKFCQIAKGVEFMMNDANHRLNTVTTYPFYTLEGWDAVPPAPEEMPYKGDTVIGNDVWIGEDALILPGVHIGDGAIIGARSVVGSDVPAYTIVAGNPAKPVRRRFDDELVSLLESFRWWDRPVEEIQSLLPLLSSSDLPAVKEKLKDLLGQ